jgi:hypothetical protein
LAVSDENMLKQAKPRNDQSSGAMSQEKNVTKAGMKAIGETQDAWANL